ncbi:ABC transporter ATP-binding protein [Nonomuraea turkmeniaca]|uniref:ABC transporter ATP-binding protein n=1 Tax=Nonomuraea turkmeniaca TaxID=103838 RepID=A0A5S4FH69_9ACTN|nr:ATP-binding cassette domain-containing protein [Nonomuraea turkmeniaca]TMR19301.1 ABC transporter ATP-binding protein [Nonomuraea turkmeniaca]
MILDVQDLLVRFPGVTAVDGVSLSVAENECFALVGESGCGKTTLARTVLGLQRPDGGTVAIAGTPLAGLRGRALRRLRAQVQIVFQNPYAALNPRMTAGRLVDEPLRLAHPDAGRDDRRRRAEELFDAVGLTGTHRSRYPHELSGGQCQRVAIARALAVGPRLLVLDEPTSALDVSVQAQILNLLDRLRRTRGLSYLLISHDLAVVRHLADRVGVMRAGRLVEQGPSAQLLDAPQHPYTKALLDAMPGRGRAALLADTIEAS